MRRHLPAPRGSTRTVPELFTLSAMELGIVFQRQILDALSKVPSSVYVKLAPRSFATGPGTSILGVTFDRRVISLSLSF